MLCGAHPFILSIDAQASLEQVAVAGRSGTNFSQCSMVWGGFPQARGSRCLRVRFWLVLYFHLMEEGDEKQTRKKKGGGIPQGWTYLAGCAMGCSC
jgi:hypothetical protein